MASKIPDINKAEASIDALYKRLESVGISDARAWVAMSNLAQEKNPLDDISDPDKFLKEMNEKISFILSVARTRSKLARAEKEARRLMPPEQMAAIKGKGALSQDEIWERLGWKSVNGGGKVWSRPPNAAGLSEWFPPQFSRYVADYNESPEAAAVSSAIAGDSPMLPVTMEQAKEFRRVDKMWERIDKARNMEIARQIKKEAQQRENVRVEMMDEHDRFIYENTDRFGKAGAEQVFRQRLLKELPPFFKDSKLSTKTLIAIGKSLHGIRKTPFVGPALARMVQNPVAGASAAVYGAMVAAFGASDRANTTTIGWENAANLYGMPSKKFRDAAFLAGLKDPGEISRLYGKLTAQFGDPEMAISALGSAMGGMSSRERTFMAKDLGIDETTMALIDILSGNKHLNVGETRRTAANKAKLDVLQSLGYTSGSGVGNWLQSLFLSIPGMKGGAARDMELLPHVRQGHNDDLDILMFDAIERNTKGAADAADSLSSSESSGGGDITNNSVASTNTALIINTMNVNGEDAMEIANGLKDIADRTLGSRANVLNAMDSRVAV